MLDKATGRVEITAHNHGFAVDAPLDGAVESPNGYGSVEVSHIGLNDRVVEGLRALDIPAFSVQYHPEAAAGHHDANYLFDRFADMVKDHVGGSSSGEAARAGRATRDATHAGRVVRETTHAGRVVREADVRGSSSPRSGTYRDLETSRPHRREPGAPVPKRPDINSVLVIGSGPIVIGQPAEFDYSGTQACRVLREEGVRVILVNSNPATIMTDPGFADATYIEPITSAVIEEIIKKEKPDAILPTLGGQTALNAAIALHDAGILEKYGVELIGAKVEAIRKGEDRQLFKDLVIEAGAEVARSFVVHDLVEARAAMADLGLRSSSAHPSRWAGSGPASRTPRPSSTGWSPTASTSRRRARCSSRSRSSAGRSTSSSSCATARTTASSSARSRTSTRSASTPATRSRSHPR